jgi:hypothetical protein
MIAVETQYLITYEEAEKLFAWIGELDEHEIENLNETFWSAGIEKRDFDEVARAIAIILETRCVTPEDVEQKTAWLKEIQEKANIIIRRINLRQPPSEKKHEKEWRYGEFTKFDFIQAYGYMYDSEDEANTDANDTSATCPLLMRLLNSGWANIKAVEDKATGKITVSKREENVVFSPALFLANIAISFETLQKRHEIARMRKGIQHEHLFHSLSWWRWPCANGHKPTGASEFCCDSSRIEIYDFLRTFLVNWEAYPQEIYDFKTLNHDFILTCKNIMHVIDTMDETMEDEVKKFYLDTLKKMNELADVEKQIVMEQQMRDPVTKKFIKPTFDIKLLIYTVSLATLLLDLKLKYNVVMRINGSGRKSPFSQWQKESGYDIQEMVQRQYLDD